MTTRDRLLEYRRLRKEDPAAAATFIEENRTDERFLSLTKLGDAFLQGFRERLYDRTPLSDADRDSLEQTFEAEFIRGWTEVAMFAAATAKESARRALAGV